MAQYVGPPKPSDPRYISVYAVQVYTEHNYYFINLKQICSIASSLPSTVESLATALNAKQFKLPQIQTSPHPYVDEYNHTENENFIIELVRFENFGPKRRSLLRGS